MMIWNEPSLILAFAFSFIMTSLFVILYYTNNRPGAILAWSIAWGAYFAGLTVLITGFAFFPAYTGLFFSAAEIFALVNCYMILYGICIYYRKKLHRLWALFFILSLLWIIIRFDETDFKLKSLPPALLFFTAYSYAGLLFITGKQAVKLERFIAGTLLIIWGVQRLFIPFTGIERPDLIYVIIAGVILNISISLFTIIAYLQDTRRKFISEKHKAQEADRLKSSFLANMSHEIRTPLNAILGFTQLLSKPDLSPEDKDIFLKNIKSSGERLLGLLDDILDLSKIEAGAVKVYISDVSINRLIEDLASVVSLSRRVVEKDLHLVVEKALHDGEDVICTDETRVFQILSNLLNNAVKFTEHGTITIGYALQGDNSISFFVKDTGIGISKDSIEKIFTPFFQEVKIPAAGGTGLGLAIVKGLTESLGGTIEISSEVNRGTEVFLKLPLVRSGESKHVRSFTGTQDPCTINGKRILLVEDDPVNRRLMEKFIESTGAELISTESGLDSIEICRADSTLDLVLMDLTLPDIDGYTAMEEIKKFRPNIPIVAQSATSMSEHREKAHNAGADGFIAKPIKREELYNEILKQLLSMEGT